jgi:hypothetical protein
LGQLAANFAVPQVVLTDDGKNALRRNQLLSPIEGVFEHGALADKVNVLFR